MFQQKVKQFATQASKRSISSLITSQAPLFLTNIHAATALKISGTAVTAYSALSHFQSLSTASRPIYATPALEFSTIASSIPQDYTSNPISPRPIPQRDPATFQYYTPIDAPDAHQPMSFPHTITGKHPYQISPPPMPTKQFEWSDNVLNFTKKIWTDGFSHESRSQNQFIFSPFHAGHRGKLEVEVFHKLGIGHPVDPEEAGDFLTNLIPADSPFASHQAFPIPGPNGELPVVSTIGICHSGPYSSGPPVRVHGGAQASIADVICYRCVEKSGRKTVTANLNVNYRQSIPICHEFITATTVRFLGERKALANFVLCDLEMKTIYAEGTGLFVTPKGWVGKDSFDYLGDTAKFMDDFGVEYHIGDENKDENNDKS